MRALASFAFVLLVAASARSEGLLLNFRDAEVGAIVAAVARATGQRFIYDAALKGRVTIILEDEISADEALEVLNAALLTTGFATIPGPDGSWKILPIEAAKGAAPWLHGPASGDSSRLVTTLVRLDAANPDAIADILGRESRSSIVLPYPRTNGLIIAAPEDRLAQMLVLVRALDQASAVEIRVFPLRYAAATALAGQLDLALPTDGAPAKIIVDERTNSLIVQGPAARVAEIRNLIETIDRPARSATGFHVVRVVNTEAETLADHLRGLDFGGERPGAKPGEGIDVVADESTNSLVIRAAPAAFAEIARVIGELDRIPPRVAIEAHFWDVETTNSLELGFDALIPIVVPNDPGDTVAFAAIGNAGSLLTPANPTSFLARFTRKPLVIPIIGPDGVPTTAVVPEGAAQLTAAAGDVTIRALTAPYLLAATGEEQRIFSGDQVPIPISSVAASSPSAVGGTVAQDPFQTSVEIQRQEVGVDFRVKPIAVSDQIVSLELHIEVTSVDEAQALVTAALTAASGQGPTLHKFKLDANVRLTDGAVMLVGAAPADVAVRGEAGVPFLKDIPILGWLFRSTRDEARRRRLVVAVQVNQIHSPEQERAESTLRRLAFESHVARMDPLRALTSAPYAVHVATRATKPEVEEVIAELAGLAGTPAVVPATEDERTRYDVYLLDFDEIAELGPVTAELRARGFVTRLEVVGPPRS